MNCAAIAPQIEAQAVRNKSMPLGNETGMTDEERAKSSAPGWRRNDER